MPKIHISNVCRAEIGPEAQALVKGPGKVEIPKGVMAPRQIRLKPGVTSNILVNLRWHRDIFVPVVSRATAHRLAAHGDGTYEPQFLLVYSMTDYLADPDVQEDQAEYHAAQSSDADLVVVAVIGESRSTVSVCRNIVSGCQNIKTLVSDAAGAVEASNVFLIED